MEMVLFSSPSPSSPQFCLGTYGLCLSDWAPGLGGALDPGVPEAELRAFPALALALQPTGEILFMSGLFFPGVYCLNKKLQNQYSYSRREVYVWFVLFFPSLPLLSCVT
jgi:hypothetical protein